MNAPMAGVECGHHLPGDDQPVGDQRGRGAGAEQVLEQHPLPLPEPHPHFHGQVGIII